MKTTVMKAIAIRHVPPALAAALDAESRRRGLSLNRTALALLHEALGLADSEGDGNGLCRLAGGWSEQEFREFEAAVAPFSTVDEAIWR